MGRARSKAPRSSRSPWYSAHPPIPLGYFRERNAPRPMNWLTWMFVAALAAETAVRLWLSSRQIAAVRAHRNRVPNAFHGQIALADQQKAADYTVARTQLGRWATLVESITKLWFTVGGGLAAVDALIDQLKLSEPWHGVLLILTVFLTLQLIGLPFTLWRTFRIEARFGFNRTSARLFAVDLAKRLLLGLVLGAPLALATLSLMERAGKWWWAWAWLVWLGVTVGLTWAAPRFIAPLFNRFTAITDARLKERVAALLERCGYTARGGVFVMDGSRRSAHGNAYFTGIGRNKRIVFFDTLLVFALIVPAFTFFATPIESWWSRRQELAADDFAAKYSAADDLVTALVKLYRDNATTLTPDRVHSAFYDSHPSAIERIAR